MIAFSWNNRSPEGLPPSPPANEPEWLLWLPLLLCVAAALAFSLWLLVPKRGAK